MREDNYCFLISLREQSECKYTLPGYCIIFLHNLNSFDFGYFCWRNLLSWIDWKLIFDNVTSCNDHTTLNKSLLFNLLAWNNQSMWRGCPVAAPVWRKSQCNIFNVPSPGWKPEGMKLSLVCIYLHYLYEFKHKHIWLEHTHLQFKVI